MRLVINRSDPGNGWELRDQKYKVVLGFYHWKLTARLQRWLLCRAHARYNDVFEEHLV